MVSPFVTYHNSYCFNMKTFTNHPNQKVGYVIEQQADAKLV